MSRFSDVFHNVTKLLIRGKNIFFNTKCFVYSVIWVPLVIAIVCLLLCIFNHSQKQRIGVVNITGLVEEFVKVQANNKLPQEEIRKNIRTFGVSLEKVLHEVSVKKNVVLMPAEAVIVGAVDYTQEVQNYLSKIVSKKLLKIEAPQSVSQEQSLQNKEVADKNKASIAAQQSLQEVSSTDDPGNIDVVNNQAQ